MANWQKAVAGLREFKRQWPTLVGNEMVNYALDNLRAQGYLGVPWAPRKPSSVRNIGRRLLIDTSDGERSIRISASTPTHVDLTANEYMEAHNAGENKTVSVRSHTRTRNGRTERVKSFTRKMNLPKRTFIEPDKELDKRILKTLETRFKKLVL